MGFVGAESISALNLRLHGVQGRILNPPLRKHGNDLFAGLIVAVSVCRGKEVLDLTKVYEDGIIEAGDGDLKKSEVKKYDEIFETAKNDGRHAGTYRQSMEKTDAQLDKSIRSHEQQVADHYDKISNPRKYAPKWNEMDKRVQEGLLKRWQKDIDKNKEAAEIEKRAREERKKI